MTVTLPDHQRLSNTFAPSLRKTSLVTGGRRDSSEAMWHPDPGDRAISVSPILARPQPGLGIEGGRSFGSWAHVIHSPP